MFDDPTLVNDWHPVAHLDDLRPGELCPARLLEEDIVLWRSGEGVEIWRDRCPHRGARLSLGRVRSGRVVCPYHGLEFAPGGRCVRVPSRPDDEPPTRAHATTYRARERHGIVWVSLGDPAHDLFPFPEADTTGYRVYYGGRYACDTSAPRAIENFLDLAHFPFVHPGVLGEEPHTEVADYHVELTAEGLVARDCRAWQPNPMNTHPLDVEGIEVDYAYHVARPLTAKLTKSLRRTRADGTPMLEAIVLSMTPVEPDKSIGWVLIASNYEDEYEDEQVRDIGKDLMTQDMHIIESQRPKLLPLDVDAEVHVRADRTSIQYRKWLRQLGMRFGTISNATRDK